MTAPGFSPVAADRGRGTPSLPYAAVQDDGDLRAPVDPRVFVTSYSRPLPAYEEVFRGPGYDSRPLPTSGAAVAALVCGIVGVFTLVPALAAIALGHVGLVQTSRNTHGGRGLAIGGLVLGYGVAGVALLLTVAIWIAES